MTVARWHSNPDFRLRRSGDTIDSHQRRVCTMCVDLAARLRLPLDGSDLPRAALQHDEAERVLGDMPGPAKARFPQLAAVYARAESEVLREMGIKPFRLTDDEWAILKLCDKLDAILWAKAHGVCGGEWLAETLRLRAKAAELALDALAWVDEALDSPQHYIAASGETMGVCA